MLEIQKEKLLQYGTQIRELMATRENKEQELSAVKSTLMYEYQYKTRWEDTLHHQAEAVTKLLHEKNLLQRQLNNQDKDNMQLTKRLNERENEFLDLLRQHRDKLEADPDMVEADPDMNHEPNRIVRQV